MQTNQTITRLILTMGPPDRAVELGQMAYVQWLDDLPGQAAYEEEAICAYLAAIEFDCVNPAVAVFCELLRASLRDPLGPLDLDLPARRRGGRAARHARL